MTQNQALWDEITSFENLYKAYKKARKGKRKHHEVATFELELENNLFTLQHGLQTKSYQLGAFRQFTLYERKPRLISAAPFADRVIHHALMNITEPLLDRFFIDDSYACRKQKGVHKAVKQYQHWSKNYYYALKLDITRYFPSIDLEILQHQLNKIITEKDVLWLFEKIIQHQPPQNPGEPINWFAGDDLCTPFERKKGLPIGNLTSQVLANLYLNDLDHFIKETLQVNAYLRYVDDMILLANSTQKLYFWREEIDKKMKSLRLIIHPRKANIFQTRKGVDVLGYQVFPDYCLLRNDNGYRFRRKLNKYSKQYAKNKLNWEDFNPSVQSWLGHAKQADTKGLRQKIFSAVIFKRE